jgi:hypothetical protein
VRCCGAVGNCGGESAVGDRRPFIHQALVKDTLEARFEFPGQTHRPQLLASSEPDREHTCEAQSDPETNQSDGTAVRVRREQVADAKE